MKVFSFFLFFLYLGICAISFGGDLIGIEELPKPIKKIDKIKKTMPKQNEKKYEKKATNRSNKLTKETKNKKNNVDINRNESKNLPYIKKTVLKISNIFNDFWVNINSIIKSINIIAIGIRGLISILVIILFRILGGI